MKTLEYQKKKKKGNIKKKHQEKKLVNGVSHKRNPSYKNPKETRSSALGYRDYYPPPVTNVQSTREITSLPSSSPLHHPPPQRTPKHPGRQSYPADNGYTQKTLYTSEKEHPAPVSNVVHSSDVWPQPTFSNFIIYQSAQTLTLQVLRLVVQQRLIVASGFCIIPETVISECEIVETFAATLRVVAEYVCNRIGISKVDPPPPSGSSGV